MRARRRERQRKGLGFPSSNVWAAGVLAVLGIAAFLTLGGSQRPAASKPDPMAGLAAELSQKASGEYTQIGAVAVSTQRVDVGQLPLNKRHTYTFKVRNTSEQPVTLGRGVVTMLEGC